MPTELIWKSQQYSVDYHLKDCIVGQKCEDNITVRNRWGRSLPILF